MANEPEDTGRVGGSLMDGIPSGEGELRRALMLQHRAAEVGFDWVTPQPILDKLDEEIGELQSAMATGDAGQMEDELGDTLFVVVNLARRLNVDPAAALGRANIKFERRFRALERLAGSAAELDGMTLDEMELLWQRVKADGVE